MKHVDDRQSEKLRALRSLWKRIQLRRAFLAWCRGECLINRQVSALLPYLQTMQSGTAFYSVTIVMHWVVSVAKVRSVSDTREKKLLVRIYNFGGKKFEAYTWSAVMVQANLFSNG